MHTGGPGVRHENVKSWKMRNTLEDLKNDEITKIHEKKKCTL